MALQSWFHGRHPLLGFSQLRPLQRWEPTLPKEIRLNAATPRPTQGFGKGPGWAATNAGRRQADGGRRRFRRAAIRGRSNEFGISRIRQTKALVPCQSDPDGRPILTSCFSTLGGHSDFCLSHPQASFRKEKPSIPKMGLAPSRNHFFVDGACQYR